VLWDYNAIGFKNDCVIFYQLNKYAQYDKIIKTNYDNRKHGFSAKKNIMASLHY
jgi:hypothetical protein